MVEQPKGEQRKQNMMTFSYTARDKRGSKVSGSVDATNRVAAIKRIEGMGYVPLSIQIKASSSIQIPLLQKIVEKRFVRTCAVGLLCLLGLSVIMFTFWFKHTTASLSTQKISNLPAEHTNDELYCGRAEPAGQVKCDADAYGTGFFVTPDGYFLSNYHVVQGAKRIVLVVGGEEFTAEVLKTDKPNDVAVLKAKGQFSFLEVGDSRRVTLGDSVFTIGFPNPEVQGVAPKFTKGEISSVSGYKDDPRLFQISVPIQPGNSGGPLVDSNGKVVGITTASLSALGMLFDTGTLPQNVNYAIKIIYADLLVDSVPALRKQLDSIHRTPGTSAVALTNIQAAVGLVKVWQSNRRDGRTWSPSPLPGTQNIVFVGSEYKQDGIYTVTIRNNNSFAVRNVELRVPFYVFDRSRCTLDTERVVLMCPFTVTNLITPGMSCEFTDSDSRLRQHGVGATEEWMPWGIQVISYEKAE